MTTELNVFNISTQVGDDEEYHDVNLLDCLDQEYVDEVLLKYLLELCLTAEEAKLLDSTEVGYLYSLLDEEDVMGSEKWIPTFEELPIGEEKTLPSSVQAPKLELNVLPNTLKYIFWGEHETFPLVISSSLEDHQESKLIEVL